MRKNLRILGIILLLFLSACVDNERVIENVPMAEEKDPFLELGNVPIPDRNMIGDIIPNRAPQIEFDEGILVSIKEYFEMQGSENLLVRLIDSSRNHTRIELGDNPRVEFSLYNQSSISMHTYYTYTNEEYSISYSCVNAQKSCMVNVVGLSNVSFEYDGATNTKVFSKIEDELVYQNDILLQNAFEESFIGFNLEREENAVLNSANLKMVQQMLLSSYYVQETLIDESTLSLIQPLLIQSQLFSLPLSYIHTSSSAWIMGDVILNIFVDAYNQVNGTYYVQEVIPIEYEYMGQWIIRDVVLLCDRGRFSVSLDGISSFYYEYYPEEGSLLLNGSDYFTREEESIFVESALPSMLEFYSKYYEYCVPMEQLIVEIQGVLKD